MLELKDVTSPGEHAAYRKIREDVFVKEQNCPPDIEWDEHDLPESSCTHLIALLDGEIIATARWWPIDDSTAKLERFAIVRHHRGKGLGKSLVNLTIDHARSKGYSRLYLHAQSHLEKFYADLGFISQGDTFHEAGIQHVKMVLQ